MTLEEAKQVLSESIREELRDHAFGDREIFWLDSKGQEIASGYMSGSTQEVSVKDHNFYG